ncbi:unnamed protein product [Ectocarpus sp. 4 AP-2014]
MSSAAEDFSSVDMFPGTVTVYGACRPVSSYERLNRIGEGAYGTVYRAIDKQTNSIVALKKVRVCVRACLSSSRPSGQYACSLRGRQYREHALVLSVHAYPCVLW